MSLALVSAGVASADARSSSAMRAFASASAVSTWAWRALIADSSAWSLAIATVSIAMSSASRRERASRTSDWIDWAWRATSACLPRGPSCLRSSAVRS